MSTNSLLGVAALAIATAAKSGTTVTANVNGVVVTVQVERDTSVASGDALIIVKIGAEWVAIGRYKGAAPANPGNPTPPDPKPPVVAGTLVVAPVETRSWRPSSWTQSGDDDVYQGNYGFGNNTGSVFYGGTPRSLAGATVLSASVQVRRIRGGAFAAQSTTMRLITEATRPSGAPTLNDSTAGPFMAVDQQATFPIPTSWAQSMVDGTRGGIAFFESDGAPYVKFAGRGSWSPAFTMTINWQRG